MRPPRPPTIALTHWGDAIEDYLAAAGLTFADFRDEMTGGWMFGYIEALRRAGVRTILVVVSRGVTAPAEMVHRPSGTPMVVVPPPRLYRAARARRYPGEHAGGQGPARVARDSPARLGRYLATPVRALGRALRRHGCTALLCQDYEYARFDVSVALGRLLGIPVFATFQGGEPAELGLERLIRRAAVRHSAGLIAVTRAEAERIATTYGAPPPPVAQIFNPLDTSMWHPADRAQARRALELEQGARVAVWHGRVKIPKKGLDVLVDAWEELTRARPGRDLRLLLVGDGDDAPELQSLLDERRLDSVRWRREYVLDRELMRTVLSAADVAVLPSRQEGMPVAPLEAMACGIPVVAADASSVPDIFERGEADGGIVVPREDAGALAAALGRLLDDQAESERLGALARSRVESAFSLEVVGSALRDFLVGPGEPGGER